jgi:hypothetical protein
VGAASEAGAAQQQQQQQQQRVVAASGQKRAWGLRAEPISPKAVTACVCGMACEAAV